MLINIIAVSVVVLPLVTAISLVTSFFTSSMPLANYITVMGTILALGNGMVQLFVIRWLFIELLTPLIELFGIELYIEKGELTNDSEDEQAAYLGTILLFVMHVIIITFLFLHQLPIVGFLSACCYGVFLLADWVAATSHEA